MLGRKQTDDGFAERLRALLKAKDMTPYALAARMGRSYEMVYTWLRGDAQPTWEAVQLLRLVLGVEYADLENPSLTLPPDVPPARRAGRPRKAEPSGEHSSEED